MSEETKPWRAEMPGTYPWLRDDVQAIVTRANAELDAKDAELGTLRKLTKLQSARLMQMLGECHRLARLAFSKEDSR